MPTRRVDRVQFKGEDRDLHALIGRWNQIRGVRWHVSPSDYVGGSFNVTFARKEGAISKAEAQAWVDAAIGHALD